ncbi:MAG: hypothetical protein KA327_04750 [Pseudarcicella sp.]|nr:hypothetical protein [Pseudarcicella sp.]
MSKIKLFTIVISLFCSHLFAQKIDVDRMKYTGQFLHLPTNPFPLEYTTYSTMFTVRAIDIDRIGYDIGPKQLEAKQLNIPGYKKLTEGGHFIIKVLIDGYRTSSPSVKTYEEKYKDNNGVTRTNYTYGLTFRYAVPITYEILDSEGNVLRDGLINGGGSEQLYSSPVFNSSYQLDEYWKEKGYAIKDKTIRDFIIGSITDFSNTLKNELGYYEDKSYMHLWATDSPKHPEHLEFLKNCSETKMQLEFMTVEEPLNAEKIKKNISYFESILTKYTADEKADKKLRFAAWYNLGYIYYWLEDFDNAIRCGEGLIMNDYDKLDGKFINDLSLSGKKLMAKSILKSRHYRRDVSNASAPVLSAKRMEEIKTNERLKAEEELRAESRRLDDENRRQAQSQTQQARSNILDLDQVFGSKKRKEEKQKAEEEKIAQEKAIDDAKNTSKTTNEDAKATPIAAPVAKDIIDLSFANFINSMNETLANYQFLKKANNDEICAGEIAVEFKTQYKKFKKLHEGLKTKFNATANQDLKTLLDSYEKLISSEAMVMYATSLSKSQCQEIMSKEVVNLKQLNNKCLMHFTNVNEDKVAVLTTLSQLQKTLKYASYELNDEIKCIQQSYDLATLSFNKLKTLNSKPNLSAADKVELNKIIDLYAPLFQGKYSIVKEEVYVKKINDITDNQYPTLVNSLVKY